ncbi:DNA polymerase III subunit gamma/tau [Parathalassolituus penaei]|uniref:DNA polymerase III subunit gamma/tau n=1 Tax=Parathalassolituus penaei TaxID=2997323 RepID=A0A9X3IV12_9GAMM|nr:DNA polymerase III subunit gamma/tau [Parathalassolituus penaei]MCY0966758.1 DNA polymerase III subunit gamma/tau [Parathalassolituus penaei]
MSYQVLARKWRPRFFDEMVGQEHVLRALINALNEQRLHHAYLFTGTRGVGKTTIARILAKCLNCEQGISARPCGECSSCREIAEGRFVDLIEVDAASRTRVEDTRELLDNVQYAPTRGRFKVYLIDEVHMLSTHSFNALLKTLEEPPAHVKFLLATTDPQKLPVTILSRCLQFSLKNMTPESIVGYLETVLTAEQVPFEIPALWQLGRAAQGSMRDALSLTDQAIAFGEGSVQELQVTSMLGTMDRGRLFRLAEVMARANASEILTEVAEMAEHAPDYDEVVQGLLNLWHRAAIAQVMADAIDNTQGDRAAILALAQAMNPEDLQLYYQIGLTGRKDLALAPDPRQGFEMLILRMLAFRPMPEANAELANLDLVSALEQQTSEKKKPLTATEPSPAVASQPAAAPVSDVSGIDPVVTAAVPVMPAAVAVEPLATPVEPHAPVVVTPVDHVSADPAPVDIAPESLAATPAPAQEPELPPPWDPDPMVSAAAPANPIAPAPTVIPAPAPEPSVPETPAIAFEPAVPAPVAETPPWVDDNEPPMFAPEPPVWLDEDDDDDDEPAPAPISVRPGSGLASLLDAPLLVEPSALAPAPVARTIPAPESRPVEVIDPATLPELAPHTWWQWVETLGLGGLTLAIARNSALVRVDNGQLDFDVDPQQGALFNATHAQKIEQILQARVPGIRINMQLQVTRGETPEQRRQRLVAEAGYLAQQAIETDQRVRHILSSFNAVVLPDSIRPLNS